MPEGFSERKVQRSPLVRARWSATWPNWDGKFEWTKRMCMVTARWDAEAIGLTIDSGFVNEIVGGGQRAEGRGRKTGEGPGFQSRSCAASLCCLFPVRPVRLSSARAPADR